MQDGKRMGQKEKKLYLEALRIIAIVFVVFNHTRALGYDLYSSLNDFSGTYYWSLASAIACKCAVPVFFMISGALLLGRQEPLRDLYRRRVLRFGIVILVFVFLQYLRIVRVNGFDTFDLRVFFAYLYSGNIIEPYWFLYAYLGFLLILPFLRRTALSMEEKDYRYLFALDGLLILISLVQILTGYRMNLSLPFLVNVILYPLFGYYLAEKLKPMKSALVPAAVFAGTLLVGCAIQTVYYRTHGTYTDLVLSVTTDILAVSVFLFCKTLFEKMQPGRGLEKALLLAGSTVFGTYLIEDVARNQYMELCVAMSVVLNPMLACTIYVLLSVFTSMIVILALKKLLGLVHLDLL